MSSKRSRRGKRFLVAVMQSAADQGFGRMQVPLWRHCGHLRSGWVSAMDDAHYRCSTVRRENSIRPLGEAIQGLVVNDRLALEIRRYRAMQAEG